MACVGGGSRRGLWQAVKRTVLTDPLASQKTIWGAGFAAFAPKILPPAASREVVGDVVSKATSSGSFVSRELENARQGLSGILAHSYRRADVGILSRSLHGSCSFASTPVMAGARSGQLGQVARRSDCFGASVLAVDSSKSLSHSLKFGNMYHSFPSQGVKCQVQRGCEYLATPVVALSKRGLSSGTSTEWWNKLTGKFKNAINLKPKATVNKSGVKPVVTSRPQEFLKDVSTPLQKSLLHYKEAIGLQLEAFWKRNYLLVVGVVGLGVCLLLWRFMFGVASTFISMSEGLAKFGFLALAAAMVIVSGVVLRARFIINPDTVYRLAMRKLNTSAAILEVMGAPLSGTDLRAYIMSGGGFRLKNFKPRLAGKRCFVIFPIRGSERRGLVSIEVKKKKGQYDFKLLAVDVPTAGDDHRVYLIGDEREYKVGGGLIAELRDPMVKAMAAQKEFEEQDLREEEDEQEELERQAMEAISLKAEELRSVENKEAQGENEDLEDPKAKEGKPLSAVA